MSRPASRDYCPDTNSHKHKWKISRVVEKPHDSYTFRQCTACGYDDMQIRPKGKGRHREG